MNEFSKLGLSKSIVGVLDKIGFEQPTPIQSQAIPLLLSEPPTDFIGLAQTGTGKTAAFGLPLLERIDLNNRATQALILAPTRELGQQTAKQLAEFAAHNKKLNVEVVYGGAAISNQIRALRSPTQVIVATPGRLIDLIERKAVKLDQVRYVVLDEADEMLSMGFKQDIDKILSFTQEGRTTWLFSATMPADIRKIVKKYMDQPAEVSINTKEKVNKDISHQYIITSSANKVPALRRFLDLQPEMRGVMFCRTKRLTQQIADELGEKGYGVEALHGDLSQAQRDAVMRRFKNRSMQLLIATDVAARGIDVNDLTHVIHHTLPDQLESYTHRSGRTARAGKKGISLAFINSREGRRIQELERKVHVQFEQIDVPSIDQLKETRLNQWMEKVLNKEIDRETMELAMQMQGKFKNMDQDELIVRLIASQLNDPIFKGKGSDLNQKAGADGRGRPERKSGKEGFNRYFINIGTVDHVNKSDLIEFIAETANLKPKYIGQVSLQKNCAYFDVDDDQDKGFGQKFKGITVSGREIRVNRDEDGAPARAPKHYNGNDHRAKRKGAHQRKGRRR